MDGLGAALYPAGARSPVRLHLHPRCRLEAHGSLRGPQGPLGLNVVPDDGRASVVAQLCELDSYDLRVPHTVGELSVYEGLVGLELGAPGLWALAGRRPSALQCPADRLAFDPKVARDVSLIDSALVLCFDFHKVPLAYHRLLPGRFALTGL